MTPALDDLLPIKLRTLVDVPVRNVSGLNHILIENGIAPPDIVIGVVVWWPAEIPSPWSALFDEEYVAPLTSVPLFPEPEVSTTLVPETTESTVVS